MQILPRAEPLQVTDTKIISDDTAVPLVLNNYNFGNGRGDRQLASVSAPVTPGGIDWISLFLKCGLAYAIVAASLSLFWLGAKGLNEWNQHRETSAQVELARLRGCFNN